MVDIESPDQGKGMGWLSSVLGPYHNWNIIFRKMGGINEVEG